MTLQDSITLVNGVYAVCIALDGTPEQSLTAAEREALVRFGDLVLDCGGTIPVEGGSYELPNDTRRIPSQLPLRKNFVLADHEDANARAVAYRDEMFSRITTELETLLALPVGTIGRRITILS